MNYIFRATTLLLSLIYHEDYAHLFLSVISTIDVSFLLKRLEMNWMAQSGHYWAHR